MQHIIETIWPLRVYHVVGSFQVQILKGSGYTESSGVDPLTNYNGDWSYDESAGMITYLISHRERGGVGADVKFKDIDVDIKMEK